MKTARLWLLLCGTLACRAGGEPKSVADPVPVRAAAAKLVQAMAQVDGGGDAPDRDRRAESLLRQAVAEDPKLWEGHYDLGVLLARQGQLLEARQHLVLAHQQAGNAEDIVVAVAEVSRRLGDLPRAVLVLEEFVEQFPEAVRARGSLIAVLRMAGRASDGIVHAREQLRRRPSDSAALAELALCHLAAGDSDVATLLVEQALQGQPPLASVQRAAGQVALARGDDAEAFEHFRRATELDPEDVAASLQAAEIYLLAGVFSEAERLFRQALQVRPSSRTGQLGLAAALRGRGARENHGPWLEAESILSGLVANNRDDWAAHFNLALLYSRNLDRPLDALPLFQRYLERAPARHAARKMAEQWVSEQEVAGQGASGTAAP